MPLSTIIFEGVCVAYVMIIPGVLLTFWAMLVIAINAHNIEVRESTLYRIEHRLQIATVWFLVLPFLITLGWLGTVCAEQVINFFVLLYQLLHLFVSHLMDLYSRTG